MKFNTQVKLANISILVLGIQLFAYVFLNLIYMPVLIISLGIFLFLILLNIVDWYRYGRNLHIEITKIGIQTPEVLIPYHEILSLDLMVEIVRSTATVERPEVDLFIRITDINNKTTDLDLSYKLKDKLYSASYKSGLTKEQIGVIVKNIQSDIADTNLIKLLQGEDVYLKDVHTADGSRSTLLVNDDRYLTFL